MYFTLVQMAYVLLMAGRLLKLVFLALLAKPTETNWCERPPAFNAHMVRFLHSSDKIPNGCPVQKITHL